jgi:hypothetical protein
MFFSKNHSSYFIIIYLILTFVTTAISQNTYGQYSKNKEMVHDTIFVYDTVWENETVYDTVWVYDTVFVDESLLGIKKLNPIEINRVESFPQETKTQLISRTYSPIQPLHPSLYKTNGSDKPIKDKYLTDSNDNKFSSDEKLTLNPFKGVFDPSVFRNGTISLEGYSGTLIQQTQYVFSSNNAKNQSLKDASTNLTGLEYGLRFNYNIHQLTIQSGIGISQLREKFNYSETKYQIDSIEQTTVINRLTTINDTLYFLDIDQLINGDSVWTAYVNKHDSIMAYDSIYFTSDTTMQITPKNVINTHYLLEIPLIFSWQWDYSRVAIRLKMGGVNQFHLFSVGKAYSDYDLVGNIEEVTHFTKYNFALYGGFAFSYNLTKHIGIGMDAYYKYPLRTFGESFNASLYKQSYGINFSVSYQFRPRMKGG